MSTVHGTTAKCLVTGERCPPGVDDENYAQNCCWYNFNCNFSMYDVIRRRRHQEKADAMIEEFAERCREAELRDREEESPDNG